MKTLIPVKLSMRNFGAYKKQDIIPSKSGNLTIVGANGQGKSVLMTSFFPLLFTGVLKGNKNFDTTTPANSILKRNEANSKNYRTFNDTLLGKGLINLDRRIGYVYIKLQSDTRTVVLGIGADVDIEINNTMPVKAWHFVIESDSDFEFEPPVNPNNPYESAGIADFKKYLHANFPNAYMTNQQVEYQQYVSEHIFGFKAANDLKQYVRFVRTIGSSNLTAGGQNGVSIDMIHNLYRSVQSPIKESYINELMTPNKSIYRSRQNIQIGEFIQKHFIRTHQSISKVKLATLVTAYEQLLQKQNEKSLIEATKTKKIAELKLGQDSLQQANYNIDAIQAKIEELQAKRANFSNIEAQKTNYSREIHDLKLKSSQLQKLFDKVTELNGRLQTLESKDLAQAQTRYDEISASFNTQNKNIQLRGADFNAVTKNLNISEPIDETKIASGINKISSDFNKFKQNLETQKQMTQIQSLIIQYRDDTADDLSDALSEQDDITSNMVIDIANNGFDTLSAKLSQANPQVEQDIQSFKNSFGNIDIDLFTQSLENFKKQLSEYEKTRKLVEKYESNLNQIQQTRSQLESNISSTLDSANTLADIEIINISDISVELQNKKSDLQKVEASLSEIDDASLESIDSQIATEKTQLSNAKDLATSWISSNAKAQTIIESSDSEISDLDKAIITVNESVDSANHDLNAILPEPVDIEQIAKEFENVSDEFAQHLNIPKTTIASILHNKSNLDNLKEKMYKMISDTYQLSGLNIANITPQNLKNDSSEIVDLLKQISEFIERQEQTLESNTNRNDDAIKSYLQATQSAIRRRQDFINDLTEILRLTNQNQEIQIGIEVSKNETLTDDQLESVINFDGHDYENVTFITELLNKIMSDASTSEYEKDNILKNALDFRTWFNFDFKISRNHGASFELITDDFIGGNNSGSATGSGAEKSKAIMIPMLILPMMLLNSTSKDDTPHILTLDEIGNKLDSRVTQGILHTLDELGFSYVATTPLADKDKLLADDIDNEFIQVHAFKELNEKFPDAIAFNTIESIGSWN